MGKYRSFETEEARSDSQLVLDLAWWAHQAGAGDSFLGAMVSSLANSDSLETALRYGVAGGSAALLNPGTELCLGEDVHRLASEVIVTPVAGNPR